jgi:S1-C subfamily serine protease
MRFRALLLTAALVGGFVYLTTRSQGGLSRVMRPVKGITQMWSDPDPVRTAGLSADEVNNIDIYKMARQATVNITSTVYRRDFFFQVYPTGNSGSGFIISDDGKILTNSHVLQGSSRIQVTLENKDIYEARVLARDPRNDLGLIQITPKKKLPVLRLGDSDHIQVGQKVLAIGNPFGLEGTLTTGIISSNGRTIRGENGVELEGMMQTDAAINPGNSGGPLLDSQGNVIGINTAIYGPSGGNVGIGFAMPINRAKQMMEDYASGRSFRRPKLGISVALVAGDLAEALDLPAQGGLLIQDVQPGSAAAAAGLRGPRQIVIIGNNEVGVGGDLIMAIDGRAIERVDALTRALSKKRPGDSIELTIFRGGRTQKVTVRLGEDPSEPV